MTEYMPSQPRESLIRSIQRDRMLYRDKEQLGGGGVRAGKTELPSFDDPSPSNPWAGPC
jgi:hypothetical protein